MAEAKDWTIRETKEPTKPETGRINEGNPSHQRHLDTVANVVQIITGLSLTAGIILGLINLWSGEAQRRLETLDHIKKIIAADMEIQRDITKLDVKGLGTYESLEREGLGPGGPPRSGRNLYFSDRLKAFSTIGQHYEQMGAMVRRGYIDFDLLFDIIAFPDEFWTESKPLRAQIAANWRGRGGDGMGDLWDNFTWLCKRYQKARKENKLHFIKC